MAESNTSDTNSQNIRAKESIEVMWDPGDPVESLRKVRLAVEEEGQKAIAWYWKAKGAKSFWSRWIQASALVLTALAGLAPVIFQILKSFTRTATFAPADSGPIATLLIGVAASLIGLDKAFGFSTGWTRYVLTATSMTKLLHEFRMDWVALIAVVDQSPSKEQQAQLIQRAKDFVAGIQAMVMQETKDWATEFQSNMAQMEKDLKAQLDQLKAQVEKESKAKEDATKPGSIELTVPNADKTDGFQFDVTLEGQSVKVSEPVPNNKVWTRIDTAPGHYKVTVTGKAKGVPVAISAVIEVKPGETATPQLTLPIA